MNYRYYWFFDTTMVRSADDARKLGKQVSTFLSTLKSTKRSAEDEIMDFDFFIRFLDEAGALGISKA